MLLESSASADTAPVREKGREEGDISTLACKYLQYSCVYTHFFCFYDMFRIVSTLNKPNIHHHAYGKCTRVDGTNLIIS
jgi:hypothetical protein